jgi:phosphinothricin acetyltransferase
MQIRPATLEDAPAINEIYNHYVRTSHATFDVDPTSVESRLRWLEGHANGRHRVLVAVDEDRVVAYASSTSHRPRPAYATTVETSVYVDPAHVGRGIGTALYLALIDAIADADVHRIVAGIAQPNEASVALHERLGFVRVGRFTEQGRKFGRYWDVDWYERALDAH